MHFLEAAAPTVEGVLVPGFLRLTVAGHYRLKLPSILAAVGKSTPVDDELWVPKNRVFLIETVKAAA